MSHLLLLPPALARQLPADLLARLLELAAGSPNPPRRLRPVPPLRRRRRPGPGCPDCNIRTDTGKTLPHAVLEFKSTRRDEPPDALAALRLRPIKLSKFLWATEV